MDKLPPALERKLIRLSTRLIDQKRGRRLVEPDQRPRWLLVWRRQFGPQPQRWQPLSHRPLPRRRRQPHRTDRRPPRPLPRHLSLNGQWTQFCRGSHLGQIRPLLRLGRAQHRRQRPAPQQAPRSSAGLHRKSSPLSAARRHFSEAGHRRLEHRRLLRHLHQPARPTGIDCPTADERRSSLSASQRPSPLDWNGPAASTALLRPSVHLVCQHFGSRRTRG